MRTPRLPLCSLLLLLLVAPLIARQNSAGLKFLSSVNPSPGVTYSEVTSCGDLAIIGAALARESASAAISDTNNSQQTTPSKWQLAGRMAAINGRL